MKAHQGIKRAWIALIVLTLISIGILINWLPRLYQTGNVEESAAIIQVLENQFPNSTIHDDIENPNIIVVVHNGANEQCARAMKLLKSIESEHDAYSLVVYSLDEQNYLAPLKSLSGKCWVDTELTNQWLVYPTIFFEDKVFIGYGPSTRKAIKKIINGTYE
jgi:competence protein ComGC